MKERPRLTEEQKEERRRDRLRLRRQTEFFLATPAERRRKFHRSLKYSETHLRVTRAMLADWLRSGVDDDEIRQTIHRLDQLAANLAAGWKFFGAMERQGWRIPEDDVREKRGAAT